MALSSANANPIGVQFSSTLGNGALAGTQVWGSFVWDDTGATSLTAPISTLVLNIGNQRFNLSQGIYPAYVQGPHLNPVSGFGGTWGPYFELQPQFLFGGLTHFGLFAGGAVFLGYSYSPTVPVQYVTQAQVSLIPTSSIPGPSTLVLGVLGMATAWFSLRKRSSCA